MKVVGAVGNASTYCLDCSIKNWGSAYILNGMGETPTDREGNDIGIMFDDSEWDYKPACDSCGQPIPVRVIGGSG